MTIFGNPKIIHGRDETVLEDAQKMKFSIKDFLSKCDQIRRKLRIWSHLLKKSLMGNFFFCAVEDAVWQVFSKTKGDPEDTCC